MYGKISIDRPGGIHFLSTHDFWIIHKRTKIKTYSERVETLLSEYAFIFLLWQVVQELCVEKKVDTAWFIYRVFTVVTNIIDIKLRLDIIKSIHLQGK